MKRPAKPQEEVLVTQQIYQGPLPPPKVLESYDKIRPGTAQEIMELAQEAQRHSIFMDRQEVRREFWSLTLGFILGLVGQLGSIAITLAGFYMAYFYIKAGEPTLGYWIAGSATVICGYLIWWKVQETKKDKR